MFPDKRDKPLTLFVHVYRFKYSENKKDDKFSPCLTPTVHSKNSELNPLTRTFDLIPLYILVIILKHFPSILFDNTLFHTIYSTMTSTKTCLVL